MGYDVTMRIKVDIGFPSERFITLTDSVWGSISQRVSYASTDAQGRNYYTCGIVCSGSVFSNPTTEPVFRVAVSGAVEEAASTFGVVSVSRRDGLPDDCGNLPKSYPPFYNGDPPPSELVRTRPVPDSGGNNFNIPFSYIDGLIDNNFNIKVDVGGITFVFDSGGVTFNYGNKGSGDGSPGSFDSPSGLPPGLGDRLDGIEDKLDETGDKLDEANDKLDDSSRRNRERDRKPPDDPDYEEDPKEPGDQEEDGIERFKWLVVELTRLPVSGKIITKSDGQIITYAGWVEFRVKGRGLPRIQLNYPLGIFPAPESCDGYAVTFTNGAEGKVTVIKEKPPLS